MAAPLHSAAPLLCSLWLAVAMAASSGSSATPLPRGGSRRLAGESSPQAARLACSTGLVTNNEHGPWVVTQPKGCDDGKLRCLENNLPAEVEWRSSQDGVCMMVVHNILREEVLLCANTVCDRNVPGGECEVEVARLACSAGLVTNNEHGPWVVTQPKGCDDGKLQCLDNTLPEKVERRSSQDGVCMMVVHDIRREDVLLYADTCHRNGTGGEVEVEADATLCALQGPRGQASGAVGNNGPALRNLVRIDAREGLEATYLPSSVGGGVHVYVLGTGIRTTHEEFEGRAVPTLEILGSNPVECERSDASCAADRIGLGTHSASIIGGMRYGVAKNVSLHAVKIFCDSGHGRLSWLISAFAWVIAKRQTQVPNVITAWAPGLSKSPALAEVVRLATETKITVVVAAGDEGKDACATALGSIPEAIVVGSIAKDDTKLWSSNFGSCIDVFAPGSEVTAAWIGSDTDERKQKGGTRAASAHAAGAVAFHLSVDTSRSPKEVAKLLVESATTFNLNIYVTFRTMEFVLPVMACLVMFCSPACLWWGRKFRVPNRAPAPAQCTPGRRPTGPSTPFNRRGAARFGGQSPDGRVVVL